MTLKVPPSLTNEEYLELISIYTTLGIELTTEEAIDEAQFLMTYMVLLIESSDIRKISCHYKNHE